MRALHPLLVPFAGVALLAGCENPAPPPAKQPLTPVIGHHFIEDVSAPWAASFSKQGILAAISHGDNYLVAWRPLARDRFEEVARDSGVAFHPDSLRWVDWDQDGVDELVVAAEGANQMQLWRLRDQKLELAGSYHTGVYNRDFQAADFDADGRMDMVFSPYEGSSLYLLWNKGVFEFDTVEFPAGPSPWHPQLVDWNRDGRIDFVWSAWDRGSIHVAVNQGDRVFHTLDLKDADPPAALTSPRNVAVGDLDGDGWSDLVVPMETGKGALVLYNDKGTGIRETEMIPAPSWGFSIGAILGQGANALVALSEEGRILLAKKIDGAWETREVPAGSLPIDLSFPDVDGDGVEDLLFANSAAASVGIVYGPLWEHGVEVKK